MKAIRGLPLSASRSAATLLCKSSQYSWSCCRLPISISARDGASGTFFRLIILIIWTNVLICRELSMEFQALGKRTTAPSKTLDTFPKPDGVTTVTFTSNELTSLCPVTEQPDFSTVVIEYKPDQLCIESKSLKLYLWSFRNECAFCEALASTIAAWREHNRQPTRCGRRIGIGRWARNLAV